jgi:hypothetical protein
MCPGHGLEYRELRFRAEKGKIFILLSSQKLPDLLLLHPASC